MTYALNPHNNQKSYYGKAIVEVAEGDFNTVYTLTSYNTKSCKSSMYE